MTNDAHVADVQEWSDGLDEIAELIAPSLAPPLGTYLTGLLAAVERKTPGP